MKQVKFTSKKIYNNFVEETEEGELVEHKKFIEEEEIIADIIEERKNILVLRLSNGDIIKKRKKHVTFLTT